MSEKIPCTTCGAMILPMTAERTGGLCMPCKSGIREQLEKSKEYYKRQKEYDPVRALWSSLVHRVYKTDAGFEGLSASERLYYTVSVLDGEVYNGGMDQFFSNSSGEHYKEIVDSLLELKAFDSLRQLQEAKTIFFGDDEVPLDQQERFRKMRQLTDEEEKNKERPYWYMRVEQIDDEYYKDPDNLGDKLECFMEETGILEPFKK